MSPRPQARPTAPSHLTCEHAENPRGIDCRDPRLAWWAHPGGRRGHQTAWQIVAASRPDLLPEKPDLWNSDRQSEPGRPLDVAWAGRSLRPGQRVHWWVRTWNQEGVASPWSRTAWFEIGRLQHKDWPGSWIGGTKPTGKGSPPALYLRREWSGPDQPITRARAYLTARGSVELRINGRRIGEDRFIPGWTDYRQRIPYLTYDITECLHAGEANAAGLILADGWYSGFYGLPPRRHRYGDTNQARLWIVIETEDGNVHHWTTDKRWRRTEGPVRSADHLNGTAYDARIEAKINGWDEAGYDASGWQRVKMFPDGASRLEGRLAPPVRIGDTLAARTIGRRGKDRWIVDFGQNLAGTVRLHLKSQAGETVTLRYAEMLQEDGELYTANLRHAQATDRYTFASDRPVTWEPPFTFHGFRYLEIAGRVRKPRLQDLTALPLYNAMTRTGRFTCGHKLIRQLSSNIVWGLRGNFLEVPTDCPQRDERLGWTGDAQVFAPTACQLYDTRTFYRKYSTDLRDAQSEEGAYTDTVPNLFTEYREGAPGWADAGVLVPWAVYQHFGDTGILEENYPAMARWIAHQERTSRDLIRPDTGFGDWLSIRTGTERKFSETQRDLIGTAYFAETTRILAETAGLLGRSDDADRYARLHSDIVQAFQATFVAPSGRIPAPSQTAYLLALGFDLLKPEQRAEALTWLIYELARCHWHLSTGFLGTPLLAPVLTKVGRIDIACALLKTETYPGWLFSVLQGATTMWERWNSYSKADGFGPVSMNSFNHYAYGCIGDWLYKHIAGLAPEQPGYRRIRYQPEPRSGLGSAGFSLDTPFGHAGIRWQATRQAVRISLDVPPDTEGVLRLPFARPGHTEIRQEQPGRKTGRTLRARKSDTGGATADLAPGRYRITCPPVEAFPHPSDGYVDPWGRTRIP
ncbi:MAG: family 78 glycoside hydrolase catalytic domain [Opitutales bacterium]